MLKERNNAFTTSVHDVIGDHKKAIVRGESINEEDLYYNTFFESGKEIEGLTYPWDKDLEDVPLHKQDDKTMEDLDKYIGAQVVLPGKDRVEVLCKVKGRKRDANRILIGECNGNPILDSCIFQVEHLDGQVEEYATNVIAESLMRNVDDKGYDIGWIDEIVDHRKRNTALTALEGFVTSGTTRKPVITTKGWDIQVKEGWIF